MIHKSDPNAAQTQHAAAAALLADIAITCFTQPVFAQTTLTGFARVVDADTIAIGGERIRLQGLDAPEIDQPCLDVTSAVWWCGRAAREELIRHVGPERISCLTSGKDIYARWLAACSTAAGDLGEWLVREGLALAFVRYSTRYVAVEAVARNARKGLWAGAFVAPWELAMGWRAR
jgi:endonuclease YncB( thermonuclease family)